jgi:hypothetical protein
MDARGRQHAALFTFQSAALPQNVSYDPDIARNGGRSYLNNREGLGELSRQLFERLDFPRKQML